MARLDHEALKALARKYIWWQPPEEAVADPKRLIAQVMDIGDYSDVRTLAGQVGDDVLREVLTHAEAGQFRPRSWTYWHYRLGLCGVEDRVPPLPARKLPGTRDKSASVKVSFFGGLGFGRVGEPERTEDGVLLVASLDDLMAMKLKVILQRAEAKDYRDIARMIEARISLDKGLSAARAMFGPAFQPSESLKALTFFEDGTLGALPESERAILRTAASSVRDLPSVTILSLELQRADTPAP